MIVNGDPDIKKYQTYFFSFLGGILYATAFPMSSLPPLFITGTVGIFCLLYVLNKSKGHFFYPVIVFCLGYNLLGYYWISDTIEIFGHILFPFNYMISFLFSLIVAPYLFVFAFCYRYLQKFKSQLSLSLYHVLIALSFTFLEYFIPQQFPAHLGHTWLPLKPFLFYAPYFGAPVYSFLSLWFILSVLEFMETKRKDFYFLCIFSITIITHIFLPLEREDGSRKIAIRLVQANIGNTLKLSSERGFKKTLDYVANKYFELSTEDLETQIDLIIWPETAYPKPLNSYNLSRGKSVVPSSLRRVVQRTKSEFLFGGYDVVDGHYNTAFFIGKNGNLKDWYHKMNLIPFGEYLPFGFLNQYLKKFIHNIAYFKRGVHYPSLQLESGVSFAISICYEILFSNFLRSYLNVLKHPPHFLVNLTNDSWYGDTSEPKQHLFLATWRALEFQLPLIRTTNTGITVSIYSDGSESERLHTDTEGVLDIVLPIRSQISITLFQRFGIWSLLLLFPFIFMMDKLFFYFKKKRFTDQYK